MEQLYHIYHEKVSTFNLRIYKTCLPAQKPLFYELYRRQIQTNNKGRCQFLSWRSRSFYDHLKAVPEPNELTLGEIATFTYFNDISGLEASCIFFTCESETCLQNFSFHTSFTYTCLFT